MAGLFIAFEGGEGSGKTTQARILFGRLSKDKYRTMLVREPGGTELGETLRKLVSLPIRDVADIWRNMPLLPHNGVQVALPEIWQRPMSPLAEAFFFATCRAQLVAEVIRPSLEKGITVICDRFIHSALAYQGYGRGLPLEELKAINLMATQGLVPDMVVLLDIDPAKGLARKRKAKEISRFEAEELEFHRRVHQGYLEMCSQEKWVKVDGNRPRREVTNEIWAEVTRRLPPPTQVAPLPTATRDSLI